MGAKVKIRLGDVFDDPNDLIILPCSTAGTITTFVRNYLLKYNISKPQYGIKLGSLIIQPFSGAEITRFVGFGVSVDAMTSNAEAINQIGIQIGHFTMAEPSVRLIAAPLLGAGAGGLRSEIVIKQLQQGFLSKAHPESTLTINILHQSVFGRVVQNLKAIEEGAKSDLLIRSNRKLQVFLCHSSEDKQAVRELYKRLSLDGMMPWLDEESLLPGQDWSQEIRKAVKSSDIVIVCLSKKAVSKRGYIQKEITHALDVAEEQPEGTIFLIPLRIEECDMPERLSRWHWVNYFDEKGYGHLMRALKYRSNQLNLSYGEEVMYGKAEDLIFYEKPNIFSG
jgi:hypothetical protein